MKKKNGVRSSEKLAKSSSKVLKDKNITKDPQTTKKIKSLAASVLVNRKKRT